MAFSKDCLLVMLEARVLDPGPLEDVSDLQLIVIVDQMLEK